MTCCVATRSRDVEKGDLVLGLLGLEKKYESGLFTLKKALLGNRHNHSR